MEYDLQTDNIISASFALVGFSLSVILLVKMVGSNLKLFVNKMMVMALISSLFLGTVDVIYKTRLLHNLSNDQLNMNSENTTLGIIASIAFPILIIGFVIVLNLRNNILIENRRILIFTRFLTFLIIITLFVYAVSNAIVIKNAELTPSSIPALIEDVGTTLNEVFVNVLDIISNIYLLFYYHKYYFSSTSVMKHLDHQMIYRRNWIYFVFFLEVTSLGLIVISVLGLYPVTIIVYLYALVLLELNTMIDFVKFDTVRNEITIADKTLYMLEDSKVEY